MDTTEITSDSEKVSVIYVFLRIATNIQDSSFIICKSVGCVQKMRYPVPVIATYGVILRTNSTTSDSVPADKICGEAVGGGLDE